MPRIVSERCVVVTASGTTSPPSHEVLALARDLAPYLALRPAEITATLLRCGVDSRRPGNAR
jgi:hypothetical protein